jgi:hypothetical protein
MVDPEQQRKDWSALAKLIFEADAVAATKTTPVILDVPLTDISTADEVDQQHHHTNVQGGDGGAGTVNNKWPDICSLLGSITFGMPQMCYGFLRALVSVYTSNVYHLI